MVLDLYTRVSSNALAGAGWDLGTFLKNANKTLDSWFGLAILILGIVAILYAVFQITTGLMSHGKKPTNWGVAITLLLVGGMLALPGSFGFVKGIAEGGKKTIEEIGGGSGMITLQYAKMLFFK